MSAEYLFPHKHTLKILCKSKHFPRRYERKREWVFFLNTVYIHAITIGINALTLLVGSRKKQYESINIRLLQSQSNRYEVQPDQTDSHAEQHCTLYIHCTTEHRIQERKNPTKYDAGQH